MVLNLVSLIDNLVKLQKERYSVLEGNEAQTRWMLIDPLWLDGLGYSREDIIVEYSIESNNSLGVYSKVDYALLINNQPKIIIESKSLGIDIYNHYSQLQEYFETLLERYQYDFNSLIGILTDGDLYLFYTNSESKDKMDLSPFFKLRLSSSEEYEKLCLLTYSKSNMEHNGKIVVEEEKKDYKLNTAYRVDIINDVYNYLSNKNLNKIGIEKVYIKGKQVRIKSFIELYMFLLNEINILKPNFLYNMALEEDMKRNKNISSAIFSLESINARDRLINTESGEVHIGIPNSQTNLIDRIVYLIKISNYGMHNVLISLK